MKDARTSAGQAGLERLRNLGGVADKPLARRVAFLTFRFVLGLLLSQAAMFREYAPFGVGYIAAGGLGAPGFMGLLGVMGGYIFRDNLSTMLKYIAISILVFAAAFVFQGTRTAKRTSFMPIMALTASAFVGIVFLAADGFAFNDTVMFASEVVLTAGSAYFFRIALRRVGKPEEAADQPPPGLRRLVSLLLLGSCVLLSLSMVERTLSVALFGVLSPARLLALLFTLLMAWRGGVGAGSAVGVSLGFTLGMVSGEPAFSMTFGLVGLISGAFQGAGKLACAGAFAMTAVASTMLIGKADLQVHVILETFLAAGLFMLISETAFPSLTMTPSHRAMENLSQARLRDHVKYRLRSSAMAFRALHESLSGVFGEMARKEDEDAAVVFDRAAERVCKRCALAGMCWDRESASTYHTLSKASALMLTRGALEPTDFPANFSARCLNFSRFVGVSNEELAALMYRRQYKSRLRQTRMQICRQYAELSRILDGLAEDAAQTLAFDWAAEERVERYLKTMKTDGRVSVTENDAQRVRLDIQGADLSDLTAQHAKTIRDLSTLLGVRLCRPEQEKDADGERLVYVEADPLTAKLGTAAHRKKGQKVSGDSGAFFKTVDGNLVALLSDGMGSGPEASMESGTAVRLLERFLRAGVHPENALATLNSALILKGEEKLGFVTVDLLVVDLQNGETVFYKYGAAPSYIKRGRKVSRVTGVTLPAGLAAGGPAPMPDVTRLHLGHGETVLLVSDGVVDAGSDKWLIKELSRWDDGPPRELAERVMKAGMRETGRGDDMTVMAVRVEPSARQRMKVVSGQ